MAGTRTTRPAPAPVPLTLGELRSLAGWAAACAGRALPLFEAAAPRDPRPRAALDGARAFARGGPRTAALRLLALAALKAAREAAEPAAQAAARAAGYAASSAYTHPLASPTQVRHVVAPAAHAALAKELAAGGDARVGDREARRAIRQAPAEVRALLRRFPAGPRGRTRAAALMAVLDAGLRARPGATG